MSSTVWLAFSIPRRIASSKLSDDSAVNSMILPTVVFACLSCASTVMQTPSLGTTRVSIACSAGASGASPSAALKTTDPVGTLLGSGRSECLRADDGGRGAQPDALGAGNDEGDLIGLNEQQPPSEPTGEHGKGCPVAAVLEDVVDHADAALAALDAKAFAVRDPVVAVEAVRIDGGRRSASLRSWFDRCASCGRCQCHGGLLSGGKADPCAGAVRRHRVETRTIACGVAAKHARSA